VRCNACVGGGRPIVRAAIVTDAFRRLEVSQDSLKLGLGYRPQNIRKWLVDVAAEREHHAGIASTIMHSEITRRVSSRAKRR